MRRKEISLIGVAVIALVLLSASTAVAIQWPPIVPPYDHCHVLVIGISDYEGTANDDPSESSVTDANNFYSSVYGSWYKTIADVYLDAHPMTILTNQQATMSGIDVAFADTFADIGPNDIAIVYWSGHGGPIPDVAPFDENTGYDGTFGTYDLQPYTDDKLAMKLSEIDAGAKIVILEGCHAGMFEAELDVNDQVALMSTQSNEEQAVYIYPCSIWPYLPVYQSAFTHYIWDHPDLSDDGLVSIEDVFEYASPRATADAAIYGQCQHPLMVDNVPEEVYYKIV
jgi:hypothetical protein